MSSLDEILARVNGLPDADRAALKKDVMERTKNDIWIPNPGPQTSAFYSPADLLLYGGQGGGGKTDLLAGLALTQHENTLLLRPQYTDLGALIKRVTKVAGTKVGLNKSPPAQFKYGNRTIDFGAASKMDRAETWQGNPHDLIGFDEACQFMEEVVRFLMGWNRSADEELGEIATQRVRTVFASNPPLRSSEGQWIIGMFRPWLDVTHTNKAEHGELRWFITDPDGKDMEVDGADDIREFPNDKGILTPYIPQSRTFIPAALSDNPFLINTGYQATLDAMPEPLRSAIRDGNFMAAHEDDPWQVIPTEWVLLANERWRQLEGPKTGMTAMGVDVARGGRDETVLTPRYETYFAKQICVPGRDTKDGPSVVALVAANLRDGANIGVDAIGVGADAETSFKNASMPIQSIIGSEGSTAMTRDGNFKMFNKRTEMWWDFREALDPIYGQNLAIPPDVELQADMTTPLYEVRPGDPPKIYVESSKEIKKRLGRSPDKGSSIVYSWATDSITTTMRKRPVGSCPAPVTEYDELRH